MTTSQIWQQHADESARAYAAFQTFCQLGAERSLDAVAKQIGYGLRTVARYSTGCNWAERVRAYDQYQAQRQQELIEQEMAKVAIEEAEKWRKRREEFREKTFQYGERLQQRAEQMLAFPLQVVERKEENEGKTQITIIKPVRWTALAIVHFLRLWQEMMIFATGLTPQSHPLDEVDFTKLSTEDLQAIMDGKPVAVTKELR